MGGGPPAGGEDGLVERLAGRYRGAPLPAGDLGIGDDAAWLRRLPASGLVATTDLLVEGVHFEWGWGPAELLGEKAVEVNLSDLAAMGARPRAALLTLALASGSRPRLEALLSGLHRALRRSGTPLVGGDLSASPGQTQIGLTLLGAAPRGGPLRRSGGRPGDRLVVSGTLGAARAGLLLLRGEIRRPRGQRGRRDARLAARALLAPRARLEAGRALVGRASAAMDLSDGLARDLPRLCRASGTGALVSEAALPLHPAARRLLGPRKARGEALLGGEDYELLAAVPPAKLARLRARFRRLRVRLTEIGELTAARGRVELLAAGGDRRPFPEGGFDHFSRGLR
jgi:thiamine-monophosphate kinase